MSASRVAGSGNQSGLAREWPAIFLLFPITIGFYWKLILPWIPGQPAWFDHWDMCTLDIPRLSFIARSLHAGGFPLWDPHIWSGQPVIGQSQPGPLYPLNLLLCLMPLRGGQIDFRFLNWCYILIHYQAVLSTYFLCRRLHRSRLASAFAGFVFAFGGFLGSVPWLDVVNGAVWAPLVLLLSLRTALDRQGPARTPALLGVCLGIGWLSGHHEAPMLLTALSVLAWAAAALPAQRAGRRFFPLALRFAGAAAIAALVASAHILPVREFALESKRWVEAPEPLAWTTKTPYEVHARHSLRYRGLAGIALPLEDREAGWTLYVGAVVTLLAGLALAACWNKWGVRWFAALAALSILYCLGANTPFHRVLYLVVPYLDKARHPVRGAFLCNLALAVLAAYGLDRMRRQGAGRELGIQARTLLAAGSLGAAGYLLAVRLSHVSGGYALVHSLSLLGFGVLAVVWRGGGRAAPAAVCAIALIELGGVPGARNTVCADRLGQNGDIADFLRGQQRQEGPVRVTANGSELLTNFGDLHGIDELTGFVASAPADLLRHELHTIRTQQLFGVTHHVGAAPNHAGQRHLFTGASGLKVFLNPESLPRAWISHRVRSVRTDEELRRLIQDPRRDLRAEILMLDGAPDLENCDSSGAAGPVGRGRDVVRIPVNAACRGMLVLAETWAPGWEAFVDGEPAALHKPFGVFRSVVVPAGRHEVVMRYRPWSVRIGALLTGAGLCVAALAIRGRRRPAGITPPRRTA